MATSREVRYVSPNDIGKMITYATPSIPGVEESVPILLGGALMGIETKVDLQSFEALCRPESVEEPLLRTVILDLSGHKVPFTPDRVVTIYGMSEQWPTQ